MTKLVRRISFASAQHRKVMDGLYAHSYYYNILFSLSSRKSGATVVTFSLHHLTREDVDVGDVNRRILEIFID